MKNDIQLFWVIIINFIIFAYILEYFVVISILWNGFSLNIYMRTDEFPAVLSLTCKIDRYD